MIVFGVLCAGTLAGIVLVVLIIWMQNHQESVANRPNEVFDDPPGAPVESSEMQGSLEERVLALMAQDKKLEAIKIYRAATGTDLKTAVDAVEAMQRGAPAPAIPGVQADALADDAADAEIRAQLAAGNKLEAIKIYRQATGSDLTSAKAAVEAIERSMNLSGGETH
jgi:ribosomal protein L7/L12